MDLNIHFVPADLQSKFDLVTNYGTTEHVLNQMLAMRSIHDLVKPGGLIHHDLPWAGTTCTAISSTILASFTILRRQTAIVWFFKRSHPADGSKLLPLCATPDLRIENFAITGLKL